MMRCTKTAVWSATTSRSGSDPRVLSCPAIGASSLTATSRPSSGRGSPPAARVPRLGRPGLLQRLLVVGRGERVDGGLDCLGPGDHGADQFDGRQLAGPEQPQRAGRRQIAQVGHSGSSPFVVGGHGQERRAGFQPGPGHAGAQPLGVRVLRVVEHLRGRPALHDLAALHHDRVVGELPHDGQVMADQQVGDAGLVADVGQQVQHLGLDRHVERGHRLVQDQDARLGGERPGDGDPLPLPAGQRPRQRPGLPLVQPDQFGQLGDPVLAAAGRRSRGAAAAPRRSCSAATGADRGWCTGPGRRSAPRGRGGAGPRADRAGRDRSRPQAVIVPVVGRSRPTIIRAIVVLPEPDSPTIGQRAAAAGSRTRRRRRR